MRTYLVGGAVRDELLGREVSERDWVVVGASEDEMRRRGFMRVGHAFPVFLHPETGDEHALARTESKVAPGHTGFEFDASPDVDLVTDLKRRDLTINAMAKDEAGEIIDPYGGKRDMQGRVLRHVSEAFVEDPLRVLRVARFCTQLRDFGFQVAAETIEMMRVIAQSGELDHLPRERVWGEVSKVLDTRWLDVFLRVLDQADCLAPWFAECRFDDEALSRLGTLQRDLPSGVARFALLGAMLDEAACQALITRLAPPKPHARALRLVARHARAIRAWRIEHAEAIHDAFAAFASLKPATARAEVLRVVSTVAEIDGDALVERTRAFAALRLDDDHAKVPTGREYGEKLRAARLALVKRWLSTGPPPYA